MSARRLTRLGAVVGTALAMAALTAHAQPAPTDAEWLDRTVGATVGRGGPPAAAAVVVHRDGAMTLRTWGTPKTGVATPVDPERTVFRIGSITKSFTAIAVLQLVDAGKLSLDDDVGPLLKGIVLPPATRPTRVRDLLTHRGGFDGELSTVGLDDRQAAATASDERLARDVMRVRAPGRVSVYDNMAYGLAGHLLESIEGRPYPEIIAERIFKPLGMAHSQIGLPEALDTTADATEVGPDGKPQVRPQIYLRRGWRGAGDMSATVADMARFIKVMLDEGRYAGGQLLSPASFRVLTDTQQATLVPGLPGTALGTYALGRVGGGGYGHAGTIRGFNALYMVMPREGVALFAVMNLNRPLPEFTAAGLYRFLVAPPGRGSINPTDFMLFDLPDLAEQRWQAAPTPAVASTGTPEDAAQWAGDYAYMRAEDNEALLPRVLTALLLPRLQVRVAGPAALSLDGAPPVHYRQPGVYVASAPADSLTRIAGFARVDDLVVAGPHTLLSYRRVGAYEAPALTVGGLVLAPLLLLIVASLRRPIVGGVRFDRATFAAAAAVLALLWVELLLVPTMQRELGWSALVHATRIALHAALGWTLWCVIGRSAVRDAARRRSVRAWLYTGVLGTLTLCVLLSLGYWHVLGKF